MIQEAYAQRRAPPGHRVRTSGYLLGAGLAGMMDGIVFHDLLAWHHFVDAPGPAARVSDGLFHLAMWILVVVGVSGLWRARARFVEPHAGHVLLGSALVGAGLIEMTDAIVDHAILRIHVLHPQGDVLAWEIGYLLVSALLVGLGIRVLSSAARRRDAAHRGRARRMRPT
jgi:uncharacterized membrane protein